MPIYPLPQFEDDLKAQEEERRAIAALNAPTSIVVRFGLMGLIGEYPYRGDATPGCGSKIVIRTHRGLEVGDMLTVTCPNAGCSTSVTREQMLEYIDNSGGRQYPFFTNGRALRVASPEDLQRQQKLDEQRKPRRDEARIVATNLGIPVKIVEVEPILSGDRVTIYFSCDDRVDTRPLTQELASRWKVRIDTRQVGARDEARLVADYERCGEYCCCKNFLKVLKPISMKAAKTQKATLDPLKISGRCGRLMCCLRYEEETYDELKKNLPHRKTHVGTPEGDGIVIDSQILTQLVLVRLDDGTKQVAVPVEQLTEPGLAPKKPEPPKREPVPRDPSEGTNDSDRPRRKRRRRKPRTGGEAATPESGTATQDAPAGSPESTGETTDRPRRKRRRRRSAASPDAASAPDSTPPPGDRPDAPAAGPSESGEAPRKKRRRRRRRRPGSEGTDSSAPPSNPGNSD
jgi:cell fate regulator YaaT (PSP1 superfamily)